MLVLSRKNGERINIGDNIEMVVVKIRGDKVRLGFEAPRDVTIDRHEVHEAKRRAEAAGEEASLEGGGDVD